MGRLIDLSVETQYPFDGKVKVILNGENATRFNLQLRIPGWCETATAAWTEQNKIKVECGIYLEVDRKWEHGDSIELQFEMPVRMIEPNPEVKDDAGQLVLPGGHLFSVWKVKMLTFRLKKLWLRL